MGHIESSKEPLQISFDGGKTYIDMEKYFTLAKSIEMNCFTGTEEEIEKQQEFWFGISEKKLNELRNLKQQAKFEILEVMDNQKHGFFDEDEMLNKILEIALGTVLRIKRNN